MSRELGLPVSVSGAVPLAVARRCAATAREIMLRGFASVGEVRAKGRGNVVTETDLAVEAAVVAILREEYPEIAIMSEESAAGTRTDSWMWVIDPVDGTKNFSAGVPHFGFNIALFSGADARVALTLQPLLNEEFAAVAGEGAWFNGAPMRASTTASMAQALVGMGLGYSEESGRKQLAFASGVFPGWQSFRISGSAALGFAYAACGRWDVFIHRDLEAWDIAPGLLLVREAGGVVRTPAGDEAGLFSREALAGSAGVVGDAVEAMERLGLV